MGNKPEVFLEIGLGFLRIPTSEINYNITVTGGGDCSPVIPAVPVAMEAASVSAPDIVGDNFYEVVSNDLYHDIGELAKNLSTTLIDIPAEDRKLERATLDEAGDKIEGAKAQLRDIVEMTEKATMDIMDSVESVQQGSVSVKTLLADLKNHAAFNSEDVVSEEEEEEGGSVVINEVASLTGSLDEALVLVAGLGSDGSQEAVPAAPVRKSRYLFDLDVIFQTLYELCTNETVKDHITAAREKVGELFDIEGFQDAISIKAVSYEADADHYFDVPMSDVFQSLFGVCSDKGIKNLLKKMDSGQSSIFLDQAIPLEIPEVEEIEVQGESHSVNGDSTVDIEPVTKLLVEVKEGLQRFSETASETSGETTGMSCAIQQEIFGKIEEAFEVSASITADVSRITEVLSFQDLSGQQILKIIKLLSDFQVQLLAIVVSFGSRLKHKTENATLSVEESRQFAQKDVDRYIAGVPKDSSDGILDQDTVNTMLAEFGFD